jgi:hypothetical protein
MTDSVQGASPSHNYYTDPLQAAWMVENHGMCITNHVGTPLKSESIVGGDLFPPFYIHPDSLHLLEPQVGDIVIEINQLSGQERPCRISNDEHLRFWVGPETIIIRRNGKAFHWPASEAA